MIKCETSKHEIEAFFKQASKLLHQYMLNALTKLGEECVVRIRDRSADESWIDHTGNLRSSIGYAVYNHGLTFIQSSFPTVLNGGKGQQEGRSMIKQLANEYSNVFALVVVAAMDYADKVEAIQSKDVLESTKIWAQGEVEERLNRAIEEATKVINSW